MDRKKKSSHQLRKDGLQIGSQTPISTSTSGRCGCSMEQCHLNYPAICSVDSGKCQVSKISLPCDSGVGNDYSTEDSHGKHQEGDRVEPSWQKLPRTDSLGEISGRSQMESFPECQGCQCWLAGCCINCVGLLFAVEPHSFLADPGRSCSRTRQRARRTTARLAGPDQQYTSIISSFTMFYRRMCCLL
jgi:hypothetical protein